MIQIVEGAPGSGKSFFFVHYLLKFADYDSLYDEYILKPNVLVITNVEGLKVKHWKFPECMKEKSVTEFFTIENFETIQKKTGKNHIILALDEAHEFFPSDFKSSEVYNFFAYHRHIGLDVFLMTQGVQAISRLFLPLFEFVVQAQPRSAKIAKAFLYHYKSKKGLFLYSKVLRQDKKVFNAYVSMREDEKQKPKNAAMIWLAFTLVLFCCAGFLFYYAVGNIKNKGKQEISAKNEPKTEQIKGIKGAKSVNGFPVMNEEKKETQVDESLKVPPLPEIPSTEINQDDKGEALKVDAFIEHGGQITMIVNGIPQKLDERFTDFDPVYMTVRYSKRRPEIASLRAGGEGSARLEPVANAAGAKPLGVAAPSVENPFAPPLPRHVF